MDLDELLDLALSSGDDTELRAHLVAGSGLPGPRLNLRLVADFADSVGSLVGRPNSLAQPLEVLLDGWAALSAEEATGNPTRGDPPLRRRPRLWAGRGSAAGLVGGRGGQAASRCHRSTLAGAGDGGSRAATAPRCRLGPHRRRALGVGAQRRSSGGARGRCGGGRA